MDYIEIDFTINPVEPFSDIIISQLADAGFDSFVSKNDGFKAYIPQNDFDINRVNEIIEANSENCKIQLQTTFIPAQNWNQEWEQSFQPIQIGEECIVRAPFHEIQLKFKYEIIIEPKMSFGTGHHETTFQMLEAMLKTDFKNLDVLDMGCGSGILAILASFKGAKNILAIDIDEWCYQNTLENVKVNNTKNVIVNKGGGEILTGKNFDIILANINKNVLLAQFKQYSDSINANGSLFISGFFNSDVNDLVSEAKKHGFNVLSTSEKNSWAMVKFVKS